jgi:hypothetical protein
MTSLSLTRVFKGLKGLRKPESVVIEIHQHTVFVLAQERLSVLLVGAVAMSSHTGSGETAAGGGGSKRRAADADQDGGETSAGGKIPKLRFTMPTQKPQDEYDDDGGGEDDDMGGSSDEEGEKDWTDMMLKANHSSRPLFVGKNKHIFLERFSAFFKFAEVARV